MRLRPLFNAVRCLKVLFAGSIFLIFCSFSPSTVFAQQSFSSTTPGSPLPDAPQPSQRSHSSAINDAGQTGDGAITGTVLDQYRDVLQGARVTLTGPANSGSRSVDSGSNGQFAFNGLPPGMYELTVSAPGMSTFNSAQISVLPGGTVVVPAVTLTVSGVKTSITVNETAQQLSERQMHIAVQQRVMGVIPNFYSAYDWNAPPMLAKQKFQLSLRSTFDPVALLSVAGLAGAEQYKNIFPAYGSGIEGYGKRYGAALATHASGILLGRGMYPAIFHQDPRYFYKGKGTIRSRALYAIAASVIARGGDGHWQPNYSRVLGNFSAAAISNLYYPASDRGASLVLLNGLAGTGADAAANLIREFLLKRITSHVPQGANGEP
jgi:Carboxypeptidase regulatory-like domain